MKSSQILFVFIPFLVIVNFAIAQQDKFELKLVNVLFRHGDRAPDPTEVYFNDPNKNHTFYPSGKGGLTNAGKRRVYQFGKLLRSKYDNFLGQIYEPEALAARSSDYDRTKMSLQLLLTGLYPPVSLQKWDDELAWQPIPTTYKRLNEDILFEPETCPKYMAELERVRNSSEVRSKESELNNAMSYLEAKTGGPIKSSWDFYHLYHIITAETAFGLPQPDWVSEVYPDGKIFDGAVLEYRVVSYNTKLKRLNGGMFVRKISEDLKAVRSGTISEGRKLYLYSGHETNIASLLLALGVYEPHVPHYTSGVIIELWQKRDEYYVKVLHHLGIPPTMETLTIPGCEELCPLDTFLELTSDVFPSDSDLICVKKLSQFTQSGFTNDHGTGNNWL